jgi:hypothetical protein
MDSNGMSRDSRQARGWVRTAGFGAFAFVLGAVGLGPLFSDASSVWSGIVGVGLFFFASGLFIGYCHPRRWWIAGATTWGGMLLAGSALVGAIQFQDAAILDVAVVEGQISITPEVIADGKIGIRMTNRGSTHHFLGASRFNGTAALEGMQVRTIDLYFKRLSPGASVTLYYGGLEPGRYLLACLEVTATGSTHWELGELAEFRIE